MSSELPTGRQRFEWFALQHASAIKLAQQLWAGAEESSIDPLLGARLLMEAGN